ncbi:MAG: T9SS type A sorting domain-containing protein [Crocinitomicaceae bacterium]|nr:T9SS type A sorting domain-containing protein [Crocinitomicaceae bacterium]
MKNLNFLAVLFTALLFTSNLSAQIVVNGDFEQATGPGHPNNATNWDRGCSENINTSGWFQGTSDLYTASSLPAQNRINPRLAGTYNFAGMLGPQMSTINGQPTLVRKESVINKVINGPFVANRQYTVSFYGARAYFGNIGQNTNVKAEIVLRVAGDCTQEKVIPINTNIPIQNFGEGANATNNWTFLTTTFTLSQAEAAQQFDAIEIRHQYEGFDINFPDFLFVDELTMSYIDMDPCPENLGLEIDCNRGEISVTNLPAGATVTSTTWIKKRKITGAGTVIISEEGNYPTIIAQGDGYYEVTMTFTLPDGTECTVTSSIFYSEDDCCLITHPDGLQAWLASNNNVVGYQTVSACGTTFNVPIICNSNREYTFDISLCPGIEGYSIFNGHFNPANCTDFNTLYGTAGSGTIPSTLTLISGQYQPGEINNLTIYATDPGLNPTSQSVNILWIPGTSDDCFDTKNFNAGNDRPTQELEIKGIHPNPASDFATVSLNQSASGAVGVFSTDGRELKMVSFNDQNEITFETMDLPNGMYIVKIMANNKTITHKLIKE